VGQWVVVGVVMPVRCRWVGLRNSLSEPGMPCRQDITDKTWWMGSCGRAVVVVTVWLRRQRYSSTPGTRKIEWTRISFSFCTSFWFLMSCWQPFATTHRSLQITAVCD
jgi:hypothetical protein